MSSTRHTQAYKRAQTAVHKEGSVADKGLWWMQPEGLRRFYRQQRRKEHKGSLGPCWRAVDITIVKLKPMTQRNDLESSYRPTIATYLICVLYLNEFGERRGPPPDSQPSIIISGYYDRPPSYGGAPLNTSMLPFIS